MHIHIVPAALTVGDSVGLRVGSPYVGFELGVFDGARDVGAGVVGSAVIGIPSTHVSCKTHSSPKK
jgi:hypothetical protein